MKTILKILTTFLGVCLLCAPSCRDENEISKWEENRLKSSRDSVIEQFAKEPSSELDLMANNKVAIQKLSDFADYLNIVSNPTLETEFRKKAAELITGMFISDQVKIHLNVLSLKANDDVSLRKFLENCLQNKSDITGVYFSESAVNDHFRQLDNSTYFAKMNFTETIAMPSASDIQNQSEKLEVDVYLKKEVKTFGSESHSIWNVKLGEIRKR